MRGCGLLTQEHWRGSQLEESFRRCSDPNRRGHLRRRDRHHDGRSAVLHAWHLNWTRTLPRLRRAMARGSWYNKGRR